ncbi:MAG TPA: hypothetical protein VNG13_05600 [Mycobacteriales bacterium]|nr:hypothetical protein [Mycobacteriales bacterium]
MPDGIDETGRPAARSNGLRASRYTPIADLDPRVAEELLGQLEAVGIAAYVQPTPGASGAYFEMRLPSRPTDRLFVDSTAIDPARDVLSAEVPDEARVATPTAEPPPGPAGPPGPGNAQSDEERWIDLVAALSQPTGPGPRSWPAAEDVGEEPPPVAAPLTPVPFRTWSPPEDPLDEHFVPPDPPPLPRPSPATLWALLGMIGGGGLLIIPAFLGRPLSGGLASIAVVVVIAGFLSLIVRMRDSRPTDDDDDGAVV